MHLFEDYTVPFHVDAAGRSKTVEAVEDPVARYLNTSHWKKQGEAWNWEETEATKDTEPGQHPGNERLLEGQNISEGEICSCCSVPVAEALKKS